MLVGTRGRTGRPPLPLVATESLWGVALSALLIRHTEGVGRKLALGALLVVAGSAVIGAFR